MSKFVATTTRVCLDPAHDEVRDSIDSRWSIFLQACGLTPIYLPNNFEVASLVLDSVKFSGYLLTGGGNFDTSLEDERSKIEAKLLSDAVELGIPLIGVCRGMQVIQALFGVSLTNVNGHVGNRVPCRFIRSGKVRLLNSFHTLGAFNTVQQLEVESIAHDGVVKSVNHKNLPIKGMMWHPEREVQHCIDDITTFISHFGSLP